MTQPPDLLNVLRRGIADGTLPTGEQRMALTREQTARLSQLETKTALDVLSAAETAELDDLRRRAGSPYRPEVEGAFPATGVEVCDGATLGDLVVVLLASTLAGLRDRLRADGFDGPAAFVAELVDRTDDYLATV